jgi:type VI secretion system protein ImpA
VRLLRDDLLNPLPAANPGGENLRYAPVYDKIKEARHEDEDDSPQGDWQRQRKKADVAAVLKLAGEALASKSKDLQIAVWYCEALLRREGFAALPESIHLIYHLQVDFWDILYPQLEDGAPEFRATPQQWFASRCDYLLRRMPIAGKNLDWLKYKESRGIPYENDLRDDKDKARREAAVAEGKSLPEDFDSAFNSTPKTFYEGASADLQSSIEALDLLESFCDEKYGDTSPNFSRLRNAITEVKHDIDVLLNKKRAMEPDRAPAVETGAASDAPGEALPQAGNAIAVPPASLDQEQVFAYLGKLAASFRQTDASQVFPYLLARSGRWGELRSAGDSVEPSFLPPPSTELRQSLKGLWADSSWIELLHAAENAVSLPCGRGWLDLQRYSWTACSQLGYYAAAKTICSELRALLRDLPGLADSALSDDTPAANPETKTWMAENVLDPAPQAEPAAPVIHISSPATGLNDEADPYEEAAQLARSGRMLQAMELLGRRNGSHDAGRDKFLRNLRISQLCLGAGHFAIAYPILQELFAEVQRRELLEWEGSGFVVEPLKLLVQCIDKTSQDAQERMKIYNLLCRLEPGVALQLQRQ